MLPGFLFENKLRLRMVLVTVLSRFFFAGRAKEKDR
jgi:hypothetical protein